METILNRSENPPARANHFMPDIITSRLAFCSMFKYSRTAFRLVDDVRIFTEFLYEISKISQKLTNRIKLYFFQKLSSTTICLCTADAVNSPTMFALTIPKLARQNISEIIDHKKNVFPELLTFQHLIFLRNRFFFYFFKVWEIYFL